MSEYGFTGQYITSYGQNPRFCSHTGKYVSEKTVTLAHLHAIEDERIKSHLSSISLVNTRNLNTYQIKADSKSKGAV